MLNELLLLAFAKDAHLACPKRSLRCMNERRNEALGVAQPDFHGMVPVIYQAFAPLQKGAVIWPNRLRQAAAVCNSLTYLDRGITVGDAAQKTLLKVVEAHFLVISPPSLPLLSPQQPMPVP